MNAETTIEDTPAVDPIEAKIAELMDEIGSDNLYVKVARLDNDGQHYCGQTTIDNYDESWIKQNFGGGEYRCRVFQVGSRGQRAQWNVKVAGRPRVEATAPRSAPPSSIPLAGDDPPAMNNNIIALILGQQQQFTQMMLQQSQAQATAMLELFRTLAETKRESTPVQDVAALIDLSKKLNGGGSDEEFDWKALFLAPLAAKFADSPLLSRLVGYGQRSAHNGPARFNRPQLPSVRAARTVRPPDEPSRTYVPPNTSAADQTAQPQEDTETMQNESPRSPVDLFAGVLTGTAGLPDREPEFYADIATDLFGADLDIILAQLPHGQLTERFIERYRHLEAQRPFILAVEKVLRISDDEVQTPPGGDDEPALRENEPPELTTSSQAADAGTPHRERQAGTIATDGDAAAG